MAATASPATPQPGLDQPMEDAQADVKNESRELAPFPPRDMGDLTKEELEMSVGNSTDFMYLCMFISEFGRGLKFPMAHWSFMGLFNDLYDSRIIEGYVKDILLKCLHPLGKPVIYPAATTTDEEVSTRIERMIGKLFLENGFESEVLAGIRPVGDMEMATDDEGRLLVEDPRQLVMWAERNVLERMRIIRFVFGLLLDIPGCLVPSSAGNDVVESTTAISTYVPLRGQREAGRVLGFDLKGRRWWCVRDSEMGLRVWKEGSNGDVELAVWEGALLPAIAGSLEDEVMRAKSELNRKVTDIKLSRRRNSGEGKKRKRGKEEDDGEVNLCVACGEEVAQIKHSRQRSSAKAKDHHPAPAHCPECNGMMDAGCVRSYGCGGQPQRVQEDMAVTSGPLTGTSGPIRCPNCHQLVLARNLKELAEHIDQEVKAAERRGRRLAMKEKQEAMAAARYAEALAQAPGRRERKRVDYTSKAFDQQINRALKRSEHPDDGDDDDDEAEEGGSGRRSRSSKREAQNLSREARLARRHEHQEQQAMGEAVAQVEALGSRTTTGGQRRSTRVRTQRGGGEGYSTRRGSESSLGESASSSSSSVSVEGDGDYLESGDEDIRASDVEDDDESGDEGVVDEQGGGGIAADVKREHRQKEEEQQQEEEARRTSPESGGEENEDSVGSSSSSSSSSSSDTELSSGSSID
ncbi:hypothetical protein FOZ61_003514 [Perkinsus olseni]|uniref:Uncharacterized protein n=1 Tax=Perkinsus olseni TaxID=32597 RepID=A0A7J6LPH4_PEROL|nr:hypothetical protein FOZ61_003514 [Perkinsus olseni]